MSTNLTVIEELEEIQHNAELAKTFYTAEDINEVASRLLKICACCCRTAEKLIDPDKPNTGRFRF